jgi:transposase-like protein
VSAKLLEQGIDVSHKTIYEWVKKFKEEYNLIQKNVKNLKKRKS